MQPKQDAPLKKYLEILVEKSKKSPSLSINEILEVLSGEGRALILIFLSLPFCQPIQIPGFSTLFGIVIVIIGLRMALGKKHIWLPKRILQKTISSEVVQKIVKKSLVLMNSIRRFAYPRLSWLCDHGIMQRVNGFLIVFLGAVLALPVPIPLTNIALGWPILFLSLGLLENDGVFVLIGYLTSLLAIIFFIVIIFSIKIVL